MVLDGVARAPSVDDCREAAEQEGARFLMVLTECADPGIHRSLIEGRQRSIPLWYELDWSQVQRSRATWVPPESPDLTVKVTDSTATNRQRLARLIHGGQEREGVTKR